MRPVVHDDKPAWISGLLILAVLILAIAGCWAVFAPDPDELILKGAPSTPSTSSSGWTVTPKPAAPPVTLATLPAEVAQSADERVTTSTMYCLSGTTASGTPVRDGVVGVSMGEFYRLKGSRWEVLTGPHAGRIFTVEDKGPLADFDMWTASCREAITYGRRTIRIRQVEEG